MNFIKVVTILISFLFFHSCTKECNEIKKEACSDKVPNELCLASFKRWFFDNSKNKCEEISYSGCSKKGFETKKECEECKCN